jgi:hypothetical protein
MPQDKSEAARAAYERLARYVGPQSEHRENQGPLADVVIRELEALKLEVEWLRYYKSGTYDCLGPASGEIIQSLQKAFVAGGNKLPPGEED